MVEIAGTRVGLTICEDAWEPGPPASAEAEMGAELIVNASGSPYLRGKRGEREAMFARRASECGTAVRFREPRRRAGRAGLRRLELRARLRGQVARPCQAVRRRLPRRRVRGRAVPDRRAALGPRRGLLGPRHGPSRLRGEERLSPRRRRRLRRHRLGAGRASGRRRARRRSAHGRGHALPPLQLRDPRRRTRDRAQPGCGADRDPDRGRDGRSTRTRWRAAWTVRAALAESPPRTCRRGSAATS